MFIIYNSFAIAVSERRSEIGILRALGATRPADSLAVSGRERGYRPPRIDRRPCVRRADRARDRGVHRRADQRRVWRRATCRRARDQSLGARRGPRDRDRDERRRGIHPREERGPDRSGAGPAKGQVPGAVGRREPGPRVARGRVGWHLGRAVSSFGGSRPRFLRRLRPRHRRRAAAEPAAVAGARQRLAAAPEIPAPGRGGAGGRQPDPGAAPHVGERGGADAVARAGRSRSPGMANASYASIIDWMQTALNPDLFVLPSQNLVVRTIRFPASMAAELAAIPGVERVQMVRDARIVFRRTPVMIVAVEIASIAQTAHRDPVEGDADEMYRLTAAGRGLMVSDNLAQLQRLRLGELLEIPAPNGIIRLPIVGIVVDYSDQQGTILMDRTLFQRYWNDDSVNIFRLYLKPGRGRARRDAADPEPLRRSAAGVRADQRRPEGLHFEDHGPVVRADVGADCGRRARRHSRHRQHADGVDYRPAARAGRPASGRRAAQPGPADDLDRGAQHRRAWASSWDSRSARSICTTSCRSSTTTSPACGWTTRFPSR